MKCPPLFNKPAFIIYKDGTIDISRVTIKCGFTLRKGQNKIEFKSAGHNVQLEDSPTFYDLNHQQKSISNKRHVIVRLAVNTVKEIIKTNKTQKIEIIPVGLTLSIPDHLFNADIFVVGKNIDLIMSEQGSDDIKWGDVSYAIEAGPLLLDNGTNVIDMEVEGWKTENSIKTQAARLDYTDMRGPKIAAGINNDGDLKVLAVNGRIRESVGATHIDMANILKDLGIKKAMGFDPGGSSTLFANGKVINISPYNKRYEEDIYALPPESRFVSSIILGCVGKE